MDLYKLFEKISIQKSTLDVPDFRVGDTVRVGVKIKEGTKERIQNYKGTVISKHRAGKNSTFIVRRVFQGVGIERVFFIHSPIIKQLNVVRRSKVRRAKLYYLRERTGKSARLKTRF